MFLASVKIAIDGLKANKLRSFLTMLGIIIGVGAVIAMVSIGFGVRDKIQKSIASLGSNLIIVLPGGVTQSGARIYSGSGTKLTLEDSQAIAKYIDNVSYVAPSVSKQYQLVYNNQNWISNVEGTTPEFLSVRNFELQSGNFFSSKDIDSKAKVAVLGKTVADNLFIESDPIGATIRINKAQFKVIGILESKGQSSVGSDQDDLVVIPITTAQQRMMGINYISRINIQAKTEDVVDFVQEDVTSLLRARHRIQGNAENDFTVRSLASVMQTATETTNNITLLLGNIAGISLLVGGIGIMNIMLVSVTERTREIGIRKALGATYNNILLQFLIEAMVISLIGGSIGIALGVMISGVISNYLGFEMLISWMAVIIAFCFSVFIGLFFGIYPARKAALLNPIEALRYE